MDTYKIPSKNLSLYDFVKICQPQSQLLLTKKSEDKIHSGELAVRALVEKKKIVYGVNTGVGDLCDCILDKSDLKSLQKNIILSHACGSKPYLEENIARGALFLVINARSKGFSGVSPDIIKKLITLFNKNVSPLLPEQGSLGASGDLIPLAHLALVLLGKGNVYEKGKIKSASGVIKKLNIANHNFSPKEALSLINGTDVTASCASFVLVEAENLIISATRVTAALFEVLGSSKSCIDKDIHELKPHVGQKTVAKLLRDFLKESKMCDRSGKRVQDPYTIRCAPQIDGAVLDRTKESMKVVEIEINSVTDNPLFFVGKKGTKVVSGGNFHAQNVAFALDSLGIALTAFSKVMERRIERLMNSSLSGLPPFLASNGGVNSCLMIPHYLVAALIAENAVLAHPASIQSIPVSANQEDFVSMSMTSANKATKILRNCERILAIETLAVVQAMDVTVNKKIAKFSDFSSSARLIYKKVRSHVKYLENDRWMSHDIEKIVELIKSGGF